uniref:Uncharacterized protein n=1 Tax=Rheinheimera sp. BAL341 TaxID=1708203 RepID=A0A486XLM0_9GAMM
MIKAKRLYLAQSCDSLKWSIHLNPWLNRFALSGNSLVYLMQLNG